MLEDLRRCRRHGERTAEAHAAGRYGNTAFRGCDPEARKASDAGPRGAGADFAAQCSCSSATEAIIPDKRSRLRQALQASSLESFFGEGQMAELSAIALVFSLAWTSGRNAGYAIGGSQTIIRLITEKLARLGRRLRLGAKMDKVLTENDAAVGVQLAGRQTIAVIG